MSVGRNLPDGYTQVEYIRHTHVGYIDTGVSFGPSISVKADFQFEKHYYGFEACIVGIYTKTSPLSRLKIGLFSGGGFSYKTNQSNKEGVPATTYSQTENIYARTQAIAYPMSGYDESNSDTLFIFGQHEAVEGLNLFGNNFIAKLYSMQIYNSHTMVRDYVPAKRNSDNKIGLYDLVNNTFSYEQFSLPSGYQRVEYIQSSGTQYINTGELATPKTGFFIDFNTSNPNGPDGVADYAHIFGASDAETDGVLYPNAFYLETWSLNPEVNRGTFARRGDTIRDEIDAGIITNQRCICGFSAGTRTFVRNDGSYDTLSANTDTIDGHFPMFIFSNNYGGTARTKASMKLYSLTMYQGSDGYNPIHIYLPVLYTEEYVIDGHIEETTTPGLYDVVTGQFLQNAGSGQFTYGSVVANYSEAGPVVVTDKHHVNRVEYPNGVVIIDLTQDTVVPEKLYKDLTAHAASGEIITGTAEVLDDNQGHVTLPPGLVTITGG